MSFLLPRIAFRFETQFRGKPSVTHRGALHTVVLEPDEPLRTARRAFYAGMNALADALLVHAPPEKPIAIDWPDALRVDGGLVGGGRLDVRSLPTAGSPG